MRDNCCMANRVVIRNLLKRKVLGSNYTANCKLTASLVTALICITIFSWILTILLLSGDIHPNLGPASLSSLTSGSESSAASFLPINFTSLSNHLSFVHYNVQSLAPKLDILGPVLFEFDSLAFSETWLKPSNTLMTFICIRLGNQNEKTEPVTVMVALLFMLKKTFIINEDLISNRVALNASG